MLLPMVHMVTWYICWIAKRRLGLSIVWTMDIASIREYDLKACHYCVICLMGLCKLHIWPVRCSSICARSPCRQCTWRIETYNASCHRTWFHIVHCSIYDFLNARIANVQAVGRAATHAAASGVKAAGGMLMHRDTGEGMARLGSSSAALAKEDVGEWG